MHAERSGGSADRGRALARRGRARRAGRAPRFQHGRRAALHERRRVREPRRPPTAPRAEGIPGQGRRRRRRRSARGVSREHRDRRPSDATGRRWDRAHRGRQELARRAPRRGHETVRCGASPSTRASSSCGSCARRMPASPSKDVPPGAFRQLTVDELTRLARRIRRAEAHSARRDPRSARRRRTSSRQRPAASASRSPSHDPAAAAVRGQARTERRLEPTEPGRNRSVSSRGQDAEANACGNAAATPPERPWRARRTSERRSERGERASGPNAASSERRSARGERTRPDAAASAARTTASATNAASEPARRTRQGTRRANAARNARTNAATTRGRRSGRSGEPRSSASGERAFAGRRGT